MERVHKQQEVFLLSKLSVLMSDFSKGFLWHSLVLRRSNKSHLVKFAGDLLVLLHQQDSLSLVLLLVVGLKLLSIALTVKMIY